MNSYKPTLTTSVSADVYEDEQGITIIDKLRGAGVFSDEDIFLQLYYDKEQHMHDWYEQQWQGKTAALFDIFERYPRDGSLMAYAKAVRAMDR
ncbi:hypothetical protein [uncultured Shewanella sp.]|uniref:hypothetical protein n=1 Tax=uncultured Shewanella sp. TaxID=173975 RepID=UPI00262DEEE5|nr:hypothetical protein [uncultured Shewanella sp.]